MRSRWALALTAALMIVFGGAAGAAVATEPVGLGSSRVLDQAGVLNAGQQTAIQERSERLSESSGVDLWVVYVDEFTEPSSAEGWANDTATLNNLGPHQYLLAIATEGRAFYLSGDSAGPVSEAQLIAIEQERIQPALGSLDWVGGAMAAADGLAAAVGGGTGGAGDAGSGSGGGFGAVLIVVVIAAVVGIVIWLVVRSRKKSGAVTGTSPDQVAALPTAELARRAASALVQTDDAIRTSEQELGFAKAQFGDAAAAEFEQTLAQARADLDRAFTLQQQLDDSTPDTEADIRAWNTQIIELCAHANDELDAKAAAFDELRQLEQNAPQALARVQELRTTAGGAADAAASRLTALQQSYAPEAIATVADNPEQTRQRLAFADEQIGIAQRALSAGDGATAAVSIRAAEDAVAQAQQLEDAIGALGETLSAGERDAAALIADVEQDLAAAATVPDVDGRVRAVVAGTRQAVDAAKAQLAGTEKRPLVALESLERANAEIDALMAGVRDAQEKERRATQMVGQLIVQAQGQVAAAEDFITSRRGAIGAQARTRLAEAGAALVQARQLQPTDPTQALGYAQRANDLAAQAIQHAQNDVGAFQGGGFGGLSGGGTRGGGGDIMGAVLGGIVINSLLGGGGNRGGSRGGGLGGGFGGSSGGSRSRSGGGMSPGSFGGGGTRSRRGGGRF